MEAQPTRPRFRTDLVAKPVEENGQVFVDVTDPDNGSTFRFYEVEYSVACAMDGARDVEALAAWAQKELGLEPSREELSTVVATLGELGYLDPEIGDKPTTKNPALARTMAASSGGLDAESSFAGLLDVDDDATTRPASRLPRRNLRPDSEEDTQIPPPRSPVADDDGPRLSTDLSEHVPIGTDDVKDAVRRSQVHEAVEPPAETVELLADAPTPAATPMAVAPTPTPPPSTPAPTPSSTPTPTSAPVPLSSAAAPARSTATAASDHEGKGGGLLTAVVVILFVLALGLTGVYYYLNYMRTDDDTAAATDEPAEPTAAEPAADLPSAPPTTTLSQAQPVPVPVLAEIEGKVMWVAEDATVLAEGDALVRLEGAKEAAKELGHYKLRLAHYQEMLEGATAAGNDKRKARAERKVAQKHELIAESTAKLAELTIAAPAAGEVKPKVAVGDSIKKGDQVAALIGEPGTRGSFTVGPGEVYQEGAEVTVVLVGDPAQTASCEVAAVVSNAVTVRCPPSAPLSPGDKVTLQ